MGFEGGQFFCWNGIYCSLWSKNGTSYSQLALSKGNFKRNAGSNGWGLQSFPNHPVLDAKFKFRHSSIIFFHIFGLDTSQEAWFGLGASGCWSRKSQLICLGSVDVFSVPPNAWHYFAPFPKECKSNWKRMHFTMEESSWNSPLPFGAPLIHSILVRASI